MMPPRVLVQLALEPGQARPKPGTNEYKRAWALANTEKTKAAKQGWADRNREKIAASCREYRKNNPEKRRATCKRWENAHPEDRKRLRREGMRRAYRKNPDKFREAAKSYMLSKGKDYVSWIGHRRRARKANAPGNGLRPDEWQSLCAQYDHRCAYCGKPSRLEREHVVPLIRGGHDDVNNIVPSCRSCNASKGTKLVSEWIDL